jgi:predicted phosphoribosyltransferase
MRYLNREDAGKQLAALLQMYDRQPDVLVLALPRGGVPVAYEVARALHAPLDVFLVRKLGVPDEEELAMGAIATGGVQVINDAVVSSHHVTAEQLQMVVEKEQRELERRELLYRDSRPLPAIQGKTVILIDDGLATGASMRAVIKALRQLAPARIVVAVPVGSLATCNELSRIADQLICTIAPDLFFSIGEWYENFAQTSDETVHELLRRAALN